MNFIRNNEEIAKYYFEQKIFYGYFLLIFLLFSSKNTYFVNKSTFKNIIMFKQILVFSLSLILLSSCNSTYQYGVYVKNETGEDLKVAYKSSTDVKGIVEEAVTLRDGEGKMVIWTKDLKVSEAEDTGRTTAEHSHLVADYVNAFKDDIPSKIKWNGEGVRFERTDIGQAEFMITYTAEDF